MFVLSTRKDPTPFQVKPCSPYYAYNTSLPIRRCVISHLITDKDIETKRGRYSGPAYHKYTRVGTMPRIFSFNDFSRIGSLKDPAPTAIGTAQSKERPAGSSLKLESTYCPILKGINEHTSP